MLSLGLTKMYKQFLSKNKYLTQPVFQPMAGFIKQLQMNVVYAKVLWILHRFSVNSTGPL